MSKIGTLNEKHLHASLKDWYAKKGDQFEVFIDGFIIDIVRDSKLFEIQTGNFASVKQKLDKLLDCHYVRLIYPIAKEKYIVKLSSENGDEYIRRKSPKRGRIEDVFGEMVSIPQLICNPNFSLEVLFIREEEVRRQRSKQNWRKKGWGIVERQLLEVLDRKLFSRPSDWQNLIPPGLDSFTAKDLAKSLGISTYLSQKMAYCFRKSRISKLIGKQGRANLYKLANVHNAI